MESISSTPQPVNAWIDHQGGAVRGDGAKVGEFPIDGRYEWWAYPPGWRPRGPVDALGPFNSRQEAKVALSSWLGVSA